MGRQILFWLKNNNFFMNVVFILSTITIEYLILGQALS